MIWIHLLCLLKVAFGQFKVVACNKYLCPCRKVVSSQCAYLAKAINF